MNNFYGTLLRGPGYECVVHTAHYWKYKVSLIKGAILLLPNER